MLEDVDVRIQTAFLSAAVTIFGLVLKEFLFERLRERRVERKQALDLFRNYSDPMAQASQALFWRLHEMLLTPARGGFLISTEARSHFDQYKYDSTLYRIGSLIAWMHAYRSELVLYSLHEGESLRGIAEAMARWERKLADGNHVEDQRMKSILALWGLDVRDEVAGRLSLAIEQRLRARLLSAQCDVAIDLSPEERFLLAREISDVVTGIIGIHQQSDAVIRETTDRAVQSLAIREAWLYRDYQSGIGELLVRKADRGARRFDVVGFREFEEIVYKDCESTKRWIGRLRRIIDQLDVSGADRYDARVQMLEEMLLSVGALIKAIDRADLERRIVSDAVLEKIEWLDGSAEWRKASS